MCLITFSYKQHPVYNLVLVANRDEFFKRPTAPLQNWCDYPDIYAGRDMLQGGTWLGLSRLGKFSAVTNFRNGIQSDIEKKSRGQLTLDFLSNEQSGAGFMHKLQESSGDYGGFNLLVADAEGLHYLSNSGGGYKRLEKGLYGLSNAHLNTDWPKVRIAREALAVELQSSELDPQQLSHILHDRTQIIDASLPNTGVSLEWERLLSSRFIQTPEYGTRCTTVILQTYNGETHILEQSFDSNGQITEKTFDLQLAVLGGSQ